MEIKTRDQLGNVKNGASSAGLEGDKNDDKSATELQIMTAVQAQFERISDLR